MGLIAEDFHRCECGNTEFEMKTVVVLRKNFAKYPKLPPEIEQKQSYTCTNPACGKTIDIKGAT